MVKIKNFSNLFLLSILIVLACFGMGIAGAVPVSNAKKDERDNKPVKEMVIIKEEAGTNFENLKQ